MGDFYSFRSVVLNIVPIMVRMFGMQNPYRDSDFNLKLNNYWQSNVPRSGNVHQLFSKCLANAANDSISVSHYIVNMCRSLAQNVPWSGKKKCQGLTMKTAKVWRWTSSSGNILPILEITVAIFSKCGNCLPAQPSWRARDGSLSPQIVL